ncbi:mitotic check point protein BUB2 [Lipomyces japonicus]|uniref:mitotic check point protein BUB2 n=1 Tax=Lipomyces japonicus TaxID=56871 RepID=UPI0034CFCFAF
MTSTNKGKKKEKRSRVHCYCPCAYVILMRRSSHRRQDTIESVLRHPPLAIERGLSDIRYRIVTDGLQKDDPAEFCTYRPYVWSVLLQVPPMRSKDYVALIHRGASLAYSKIRNDTFRTLTTDMLFQRRVSETSLIRILNAIAWRRWDACQVRHHQHQLRAGKDASMNIGRRQRLSHILTPSSLYLSSSSSSLSSNTFESRNDSGSNSISSISDVPVPVPVSELYVQGMNVLAAPFLYACASETQAFALLDAFMHSCFPLYVRPMLDGVHLGLKLVDVFLARFDPVLYSYLRSKSLTAELYGFASVLTLSACTPPLSEALKLWDFLIAFGPHMNILAVIAQLTLIRDALLSSSSPMTLLRTFPALKSESIVKLSIMFANQLPDDLYDLLVRHCYDESVSDIIKTL